MKRAIGQFLLLLANIILLAHTVIPHHHLNGVVPSACTVLSFHETIGHSQCCCHSHSECGCNHNHEGDFDENCPLNILFVRDNQEKQQHLSFVDADFFKHIGFSLLFTEVSSAVINIQDYGLLPFRQKPYLNAYHTQHITHSLGLRAPPSC